MEVQVDFMPGGWRQSPGWKIKHDDCEHIVNSVRDYPQGFVKHMLDEHGKRVKPETVRFRYWIYATDITEMVKKANEARAVAENADREHKRLRHETAHAMRNTAPEDRPPFPYEFIGQLLNYEQSSVTSILRDPERRPKAPNKAKSKDK
jgi:hypothetical protein